MNSKNGPDIPIRVENFSATEMAWVRRVDLGPNAWEMPDGKIRWHHDTGEPVIAKLVP